MKDGLKEDISCSWIGSLNITVVNSHQIFQLNKILIKISVLKIKFDKLILKLK